MDQFFPRLCDGFFYIWFFNVHVKNHPAITFAADDLMSAINRIRSSVVLMRSVSKRFRASRAISCPEGFGHLTYRVKVADRPVPFYFFLFRRNQSCLSHGRIHGAGPQRMLPVLHDLEALVECNQNWPGGKMDSSWVRSLPGPKAPQIIGWSPLSFRACLTIPVSIRDGSSTGISPRHRSPIFLIFGKSATDSELKGEVHSQVVNSLF